ncbi:unnamed protein product [Mytilus coruscus]|uniref:Mab-21-like nucleotidyltransferase domain-containing protein n=1 Tax=Mytilus coruscus TaxID=42192 RepID=A0A6J8EQZ0_MYTCO|nr:unnamed protein product [Mytilus coruscus]
MMISNDVFGLTIRQFERVYKACLERRKRKEQWIINLRYPDKSSNEYLEYLENCNNSHTVKAIGTEIDIRTRQRLFILKDIFDNALWTYGTRISSGSLAEGLDLPGSDIDIMWVKDDANVIQNVSNIKYPIQNTTFLMETDIDYPGFVRLRCVATEQDDLLFVTSKGIDVPVTVEKIKEKIFKSKCLRLYVSVNGFIESYKQRPLHIRPTTDGGFCKLFTEIKSITTEPTDISSCYKVLTLTESFIKSESSSFTKGVCQNYHARTSQLMRQLLPTPNSIDKTYSMRKCYHRYLQDGTKTDATAGHFNVTLKLIDYILSRLSTDLVYNSISDNKCELNMFNMFNYEQKVHSTMTLNDKMKITIVDNIEQSSLIPMELQMEVEDFSITIPSIVMSHCLRFLCYHHIGNSFNRQQALSYLTMISNCRQLNGLSNTLTILGVCHAIYGHNDIAYHYYDEALQCDYRSAEKRMSKILNILKKLSFL